MECAPWSATAPWTLFTVRGHPAGAALEMPERAACGRAIAATGSRCAPDVVAIDAGASKARRITDLARAVMVR
jgi:hypothetical protein